MSLRRSKDSAYVTFKNKFNCAKANIWNLKFHLVYLFFYNGDNVGPLCPAIEGIWKLVNKQCYRPWTKYLRQICYCWTFQFRGCKHFIYQVLCVSNRCYDFLGDEIACLKFLFIFQFSLNVLPQMFLVKGTIFLVSFHSFSAVKCCATNVCG